MKNKLNRSKNGALPLTTFSFNAPQSRNVRKKIKTMVGRERACVGWERRDHVNVWVPQGYSKRLTSRTHPSSIKDRRETWGRSLVPQAHHTEHFHIHATLCIPGDYYYWSYLFRFRLVYLSLFLLSQHIIIFLHIAYCWYTSNIFSLVWF